MCNICTMVYRINLVHYWSHNIFQFTALFVSTGCSSRILSVNGFRPLAPDWIVNLPYTNKVTSSLYGRMPSRWWATKEHDDFITHCIISDNYHVISYYNDRPAEFLVSIRTYVACRSKTWAILKHVSVWHCVPFGKMYHSQSWFRLAPSKLCHIEGRQQLCTFNWLHME